MKLRNETTVKYRFINLQQKVVKYSIYTKHLKNFKKYYNNKPFYINFKNNFFKIVLLNNKKLAKMKYVILREYVNLLRHTLPDDLIF